MLLLWVYLSITVDDDWKKKMKNNRVITSTVVKTIFFLKTKLIVEMKKIFTSLWASIPSVCNLKRAVV